jgi:BirA family biotin operon repressor/biotin-[acetyl-CoA-carboxylase] ligase
LNVNNELPDTIQSTATSLKDVTRRDVSLKQLLLAMLASLDEWYTHVIQKQDSLILETWCALSDTIGKEIEVHDAGSVIKGVAKGISENYALLVETGYGTKTIVTGDICYL